MHQGFLFISSSVGIRHDKGTGQIRNGERQGQRREDRALADDLGGFAARVPPSLPGIQAVQFDRIGEGV